MSKIKVGTITLCVAKAGSNAKGEMAFESRLYAPTEMLNFSNLTIPTKEGVHQFTDIKSATVEDLRREIDKVGGKAQIVAGASGEKLVIKDPTGLKNAEEFGYIGYAGGGSDPLSPQPSFTISVAKGDRLKLANQRIKLKCQVVSSPSSVTRSLPTLFDLDPSRIDKSGDQSWTLGPDAPPLVILNIDGKPGPDGKCSDDFPETPFKDYCKAQYLLARTATNNSLYRRMYVNEEGRLAVEPQPVGDQDSEYLVGSAMIPKGGSIIERDPSARAWYIRRWQKIWSCRYIPKQDGTGITAELWAPPQISDADSFPQPTAIRNGVNGIAVGPAKVFDVLQLRAMLNVAATRLSAISVFNGSSINTAVGNLQGITRDVSFLNAQVTTALTPAVTQSASNGITGTTSNSTTTPGPATTNTQVTIQCPDGSLPQLGSGGTLVGCVPIPTTNVPVTPPSTGTLNNTTTTNAAITNTQTSGSTTSQQNGTTITTPSVSGVVPATLPSTALAAPSNVGVAGADILAEQVQLNSQITGLMLLLQGALSDYYLSKNSVAVGVRQQTTLGFTVNLDPPRQFKHAVAEVRVIIRPPDGWNPDSPSSIVTLLPAEKTYNVAQITSKQNSFGAGAVVQPISFGVNTGKAKDRLYLAKDTDTIALQYPPNQLMDRPLPERISDTVKSVSRVVRTKELGGCNDDNFPDGSAHNAIAFGWQFRPVLGADYVKGGQRQVFAQLSFPTDDTQEFKPDVFIQTRWRDYDPKQQVVGAAYTSSCTEYKDPSAVVVMSKPLVTDVGVTDLGAGQVALDAQGQFFAQSVRVLAGANVTVPTLFDGRSVRLIAAAQDLLNAGELHVVGPDGRKSPFGIVTDPQRSEVCGIREAQMVAAPYPDGNSRVKLTLRLGTSYDTLKDGEPKPLAMIGGRVYGLRETPFSFDGCANDQELGTKCTFRFIAPTTEIRNAQTFLVRDLAWFNMSRSGKIHFSPSFNALTSLSIDENTPAKTSVKVRKNPSIHQSPPSGAKPPKDKKKLLLSGFDLFKLRNDPLLCRENPAIPADHADPEHPCLQVFVGNSSNPITGAEIQVQSDNVATVSLPVDDDLKTAKALRFHLIGGSNPPGSNEWYPKVEWSLPLPKPDKPNITPSPAFLRVGDSQKVSFPVSSIAFGPGVKAKEQIRVDFEGIPLEVLDYKAETTTLDVGVTSAITKVAGHKELRVLDGTQNWKKVGQLQIDIVGNSEKL